MYIMILMICFTLQLYIIYKVLYVDVWFQKVYIHT